MPDAGASFILPRLVGEARARAMALLAEPISAERAEAWGMIWQCVDDDDLLMRAAALAVRLAEGPTAAYGLMKRAFAASAANSFDGQLDLERDLQAEAGGGDDHAEGLRAFREKRPPRFGGDRAARHGEDGR